MLRAIQTQILTQSLTFGEISYHNFSASESCWTDNCRGKGLLFPQGKGKYGESRIPFLQQGSEKLRSVNADSFAVLEAAT